VQPADGLPRALELRLAEADTFELHTAKNILLRVDLYLGERGAAHTGGPREIVERHALGFALLAKVIGDPTAKLGSAHIITVPGEGSFTCGRRSANFPGPAHLERQARALLLRPPVNVMLTRRQGIPMI
jgi:hypothetical protein